VSTPIVPSARLTANDASAGALTARAVLDLVLKDVAGGDLVLVGFAVQDLGPALAGIARGDLAADIRVVDPARSALDSLPRLAGVTGQQGDAASLPFADRSIAAVGLALDLHTNEWKAALDEAQRVLAIDGLLVVTHPAGEGDAVERAVTDFVPVRARLELHDSTTVTSGDGDVATPAGEAPGIAGIVVASTRPDLEVEPVAFVADGLLRAWRCREHELLTQLARQAAELDELRLQVARLGDLQRGLLDAEQAAANVRALTAERDHLVAEVARLAAEVAQVESSISWRVTTPLRQANAYARTIAVDTIRRWRS
jgi:SAM-dependent methyltransferase